MTRRKAISPSIGALGILLVAVLLGGVPRAAHAQHIPVWLFAAALSPLIVLVLCLILGLLTRSWRAGLRHAGFVVAWVVLFSLASYFVENDYVIWTPLTLYGLHAALLLVLIVVQTIRLLAGTRQSTE